MRQDPEPAREPSGGAGFALFATALGDCGIAWRSAGIAAVQLPEPSAQATQARLQKRLPGVRAAAGPAPVRRTIDALVALLRGESIDLGFAQLDLAGVPPFNCRVYEAARSIAPGHTSTYGEIAAQLGDPGAARAVGVALGQNPFPLIVPCHRVLAAGGKYGGFSASGGVITKLRLLAIEGAPAADSLFPF